MKLKTIFAAILAASATAAFAAPETFKIDPGHTYPSFEADHMGISILRGKFTKTEGTVVLDRAAKTGSVDILIDADSLDFGHEKLNKHAKNEDMFDVAKFPTVTYKSKSISFTGDTPSAINGELTLHGVTKPLTLTINKFKCIVHPMHKKEVCGADASATFQRSDYGISYGQPRFSMDVKLAISIEAVKQ
ncbi:YceI family protein [Massilia glaciei]|uniref:Polyisoprenoid-binding protein n=1 Tax=Massilia glaciei TaxID=1524097 RepID=A0A2U2HHB0_9BURK|nr:YceI family protein [Massilia glaciei]PWF45031.1 polyisoprenoid-binding protein [Massilia glaciei]